MFIDYPFICPLWPRNAVIKNASACTLPNTRHVKPVGQVSENRIESAGAWPPNKQSRPANAFVSGARVYSPKISLYRGTPAAKSPRPNAKTAGTLRIALQLIQRL